LVLATRIGVTWWDSTRYVSLWKGEHGVRLLQFVVVEKRGVLKLRTEKSERKKVFDEIQE